MQSRSACLNHRLASLSSAKRLHEDIRIVRRWKLFTTWDGRDQRWFYFARLAPSENAWLHEDERLAAQAHSASPRRCPSIYRYWLAAIGGRPAATFHGVQAFHR